MVKVSVVGATGYSGQELVDLLLKHPGTDISFLTARFDKETRYADVYRRFAGRTELYCKKLDVDEVSEGSDLVFLALPHTVSMQVAPQFLERGVKVVDLSADYRLNADVYASHYGIEHGDKKNISSAVYGLPEMNRKNIGGASLVANPGCYPTSVILGLMPIAKMLSELGLTVIVDSKSGASGAGRKSAVELSFTEVDGNFKSYKENAHQHIPEMESILSLAAEGEIKVNFVPHLLPVRRGILSTIYVEHKGLPPEKDLREMFQAAYGNEPFVRLMPEGVMPDIAGAAGTNFCDIGIKVARGMLIIVSVIDNLLKGASGQAVQNMNIMSGLKETDGLI
ncbi:MAG: N-acetyl-gamma-glutamyl-phosphate reductase [Candidatus Omnitrophica bacterium]|nr:N-acetyl-gamma-glutamyl-phosphate reductase [Candidatus Omnitrophota bacterium]MDD5488112.1 N-acetyl-gamma-glutamyl-phosphate reductase [Candidatus Omnitrophota bacterium]